MPGMKKMKKMSYKKGGMAGGTALKKALIAKGYKYGGMVKKKKGKKSFEQYD